MKKIFFIFLFLFFSVGLLFVYGTTYYVRTDGGTCEQCTGTVDAPYPGSGTDQPCAWSHPYWALDSNGNWHIQGGDTIIIGPGSYMLGYGAPNTGWCEADGAYECDLPPLPSGPDANHPTRILGKGWNSGCTNPPELWGTERIWNVLDLTGTSNAVIACLEITDHSSCVEFHSNPSVACERDSYPFGTWAGSGILASDSSNVTLQHLNIHGLASHGIAAARISDWTVQDVRIAGNGWVGWEGDLGEGNNSNSGTLHFKEWVVEWNGCGETYPGEQPHNCWAQTAGGYGDGVGTGTTGGHWIIEDSIFRYNTSDGLDLLYAREAGSRIDIRRTMAYGNAGNQVKTTGNAAIENCLLVGNCGYFNGKSFTWNVDDCRAMGGALSLSVKRGNSVSVINSTIAGQGDCLGTLECDDDSCNGSEQLIVKNNIFKGYQDFTDPTDTTCYFWFDRDNFYQTQMDYNIIYDVKMGDRTYSAHDLNQDPLVVNDTLASFDGHLQATSPAIDSGLAVGSLNGLVPANDLEGNTRPAGAGVDRGAYEYGGTTPGGQIALNRTQLNFGAEDSTTVTDTQKVFISNSGSGTLNWQASPSDNWLNCSPTSGTNSTEVIVSVNTSGLSAGSYSGSIAFSSANASNSPQSVSVSLKVYPSNGSSPPFGIFATPEQGAVVRSSVPVTGWVLDDIGTASVKIYRTGDAGSGSLVYIGDALLVEGARPDVEQAHPGYPMNYKAGWGYMMLTHFLPNQGNGTFTLHAAAADLEGHQVTLGTHTITCDNANAVKPFGAIDTPTQGGEASGSSFRNQGWVLTPMPNKVPEDGSTISVYVDGVNLGHPVYNIYRSDVATLFPGYANSSGAHAYFDIDTTAYSSGVHTIAWQATDNGGNSDGIGSRYFTIQNSQGAGSREQGAWSMESMEQGAWSREKSVTCLGPVGVIKGYARDVEPRMLFPDDNGMVTIEINELERLEIRFPASFVPEAAGGLAPLSSVMQTCVGYQLVGDQLRPLPIGSTWDTEKGIFYWQPGPGFVGEYRLVFIMKRNSGKIDKIDFTIRIVPSY